GQETRTMSAPASSRRRIWAMVAAAAAVTVLGVDWTVMGASPPPSTVPTRILRDGRRAMARLVGPWPWAFAAALVRPGQYARRRGRGGRGRGLWLGRSCGRENRLFGAISQAVAFSLPLLPAFADVSGALFAGQLAHRNLSRRHQPFALPAREHLEGGRI